ILELEEHLPKDWPVQGTTGYGFLAIINHLFTRYGEADRFSSIYRKIVPEMPEYHELVFE
ncbi:MAG: hypothetical protein LPK19_05260, partial [Hymenobacteraceae bacterium]|nr:hypothetical protein [Hymenobacteraceae bacterium]MDX5395605.1 hypothetical protein [Hymenobacteraceae bacterium]MDX5511659.1 hypothetical protein [Hymenobacteraceae bacterium]